MKRFHLYEGTLDNREESDSFDTKREAIARAKICLENAKDMELPNYIVRVVNSKTGEFVFTTEFGFYDAQEPGK